MPELQTARLRLRDFREDDFEAFSALCANEGFMRFSTSGPLDPEKAATLFERILLPTREGRPSQFAVFLDDQLIGYCGFFHQLVDEVEEIEIGYRLNPKFWGRGLATEAAQAVRDHAFRDLALERVISLVHPDNHASERVALKNGMKLEKFTLFRGEYPANVFAITRPEWVRLPKNG